MAAISRRAKYAHHLSRQSGRWLPNSAVQYRSQNKQNEEWWGLPALEAASRTIPTRAFLRLTNSIDGKKHPEGVSSHPVSQT